MGRDHAMSSAGGESKYKRAERVGLGSDLAYFFNQNELNFLRVGLNKK